MRRKSQISLFLLLGILILAAAVTLFAIQDKKTTERDAQDGEGTRARSVEQFVTSCLERSAEDAISFVSSQGGYTLLPNEIAGKGSISAPLYLFRGQNVSPDLAVIEESIAIAVEESLGACVDGFGSFSGLEILEGEVFAKSIVKQDKVIVTADYLLILTEGGKTTALSSFRVEVPSNIAALYGVALSLTNLALENLEELCLSCMIRLEQEHNVSIHFENAGYESVLYTIAINDTRGRQLEYTFAHGYGSS